MPKKRLRDNLVREVELKLQRLKKLPEVLDQEMSNMAQEVRQTARNMAPIDYGGLKQSIKIKRVAATQSGVKGFIKGKSSFKVYIDPMTPAPGHKEGVVGGYAWLVHEHMGYGSTPNAIMPSPKSIAAGRGEIVGGKFIDRAFARYKGKIAANLKRTCTKYINHQEYMANRVDKQMAI